MRALADQINHDRGDTSAIRVFVLKHYRRTCGAEHRGPRDGQKAKPPSDIRLFGGAVAGGSGPGRSDAEERRSARAAPSGGGSPSAHEHQTGAVRPRH